MFCKFCGRKMICKDNMHFCENCGGEPVKFSEKTHGMEKKLIIMLSGLLILLLLFGYLVFGTPLVLKSKKYAHAHDLIKKGEYVEAVAILSPITDYRDSEDIIEYVYDRYDGDYRNDADTLHFHLDIIDGAKAEIELTHITGGEVVNASAVSVIKDNIIEFYYSDTENNKGEGKIELSNDEIHLNLNTDNSNSDVSLGNHDIHFDVYGEVDLTMPETPTLSELQSWLDGNTGEDELRKIGYRTERIESFSNAGTAIYKIKNTDITMLMEVYNYPDTKTRILAITAPASIVLQDRIGKDSSIFVEGEYIYIPYGIVEAGGATRSHNYDGDKVSSDTSVAFTRRTGDMSDGLGMLERQEIYFEIKSAYDEEYIDKDNFDVNLLAESSDYRLYSASFLNVGLFDVGGRTPVYKVSKSDYRVEFVSEVAFKEYDAYNYTVYWHDVPELVSEFGEGNKAEDNKERKVYRVRKSPNDSSSQISAFYNLDFAKDEADKYRAEGYEVYDTDGNLIYKP